MWPCFLLHYSETWGLFSDMALPTGEPEYKQFFNNNKVLPSANNERISSRVLHHPRSNICSVIEAELIHASSMSPLRFVFVSAETGAAVLRGQEPVLPHPARETRRAGRFPPHHDVHQKGDSKRTLLPLYPFFVRLISPILWCIFF